MLCPVVRKAAQVMRKVPSGDDSLCGYDRAGYYYSVEREPDRRWYIIVLHPSGGALYDGWWPDSEDKSLAEAVQEAVEGAGLAKRAQADQKGGSHG